MSGLLSSLFAELETKLTAIYPKISFGTGAKALSHHRGLPSVVWVPTTGKHEAPRMSTNPKSIRTRVRTIVAHCWAVAEDDDDDGRKSMDACDELVANLVVALHTAGWGSVLTVSEEWIQANENDHGSACLVTFEVQTPVQKRAYQTVQMKHLEPDITGSLQGDTNVDWGEP